VAFPTSRDLRRLAECADDPHVSIFLRLERGAIPTGEVVAAELR
jgi:hypothetical protein